MMRPTAIRAARQVALRPQTQLRFARPAQKQQIQAVRRYATAGTPPPPPPSTAPPPATGGGSSGTWIILAAIVGLGAGGYYFLKPVRDVASVTHSAIKTAKEGAGSLGEYSEQLNGLAKAMLPAGAFSLYQGLASSGGMNGFLSNLKDKDIQGVIDEVKKHGNDDVKRIVDKVEKRLKDAKGKVQDVDWKALAEDLKKELPEGSQKTVEMLIGKIPTKEDFDQYFKKFKGIAEEQKKELEANASKILDRVKKAQKEGKGQADALLKGLKDAAPGDVDALVKQLKDAAKSAGLPADQIESWLKSKAEDGKVNAEETAEQLKSKLKTGAKYIPGEPKDLIDQVKQFSPSIAELLAQAMKEAGIVDDKLNKKV